MKRHSWMKSVALVVSGAMFLNCGGAGLFSAVTTVAALVQGEQLPPPFTQEPGQAWLGRNSGRESRTRGGFYSENGLAAIERAAQKWRRNHGGTPDWAGIVAGSSPVTLAGLSAGGGAGILGEGVTAFGAGRGGSVNTVNGNFHKAYPLVSWPSQGELDFGFTLYHNSVSDYNLEFGANWSFTFGAKLEGGTHPVIRWGDGTVVTFTQGSPGVYTAPAGCFDTLTVLGSGNFLVTIPNLMEFEFTPPSGLGDLGDLVAIRDRNGNEITITVSTVNGKEVVTKVEDSITSRYVDLTYNTSTHQVEQLEDHTGRIWEFVYDGDALEEIKYPSLNSTIHSRYFTYDVGMVSGSHWIETETDLNGEVWEYTYSNGVLLTGTDPLTNTTTFDYQDSYTDIIHADTKFIRHNYDAGKLASVVDENSFPVNYLTYNANRQPTEVEDRNEEIWEFTYNSKGNLLTAEDPLNHVTTYTYEANGNDINTVTNHLSEVLNYNYYTTGAKLLEEVIDPESRTIATYTYNSAGDVVTIVDGDSETTSIYYGSDGYPDSIDDALGNDTNVQLDTLGRVVWVEDGVQALTGSTEDRTDVTYDSWSRQHIITHPSEDIGGDDVPRYTTTFNYDEENSLISVTDERNKTVSFDYDAAGRLWKVTNQLSQVEEYVRNSRGFVTEVINGRGKSRYLQYTDRGNLYTTRFHFGGINYEGESHSYDGNGNTTIHSYFKTGFVGGSELKYYNYDAASRLIEVDYDTVSMTDVTFDYDDADRMIEMVDGTGTTTWDYWDDGQVKEMASPQGTVLYDYYSTTGRLQYLTEVISGGTNIVTTYTYDDAGRTETIDKFGETTTFEYDEASRPEKMTYDTGAYALYTYDGRSRIKAVEHKNSSNTLLRKETNVYDPASRITSRYEGPASGGVTTTFGYDDAGQLTSESSSGYSASYTYDANGNRTNRTVNGVSETYTVDDSDKLTSVTWSNGLVNYSKEYAYHYSGRPTSITYKTNGVTQATETMTWDKESRMLTNSLANASYVYNGFDTRVSKTVSSTTTTFKRAGADPVSPVLSDVAGSTTTNYLPGISSRVGSTSTFNHSGIKNGILQTNSSQSNTASKRYDAFGNELSTSGAWQTRFDYGGGFGYQRDDESGYKLLGHRYYDAETGRFLTRDPIRSGRNWYGYAGNDPIVRADPSGFLHIVITINEDGLGTGQMYADAGDMIPDGRGGWTEARGGERVGGRFNVGNQTTNPEGDPFTVGSQGPFPEGEWPITGTGRIDAGHPEEQFGPGRILIGRGRDVTRLRGTWIHGGRGGFNHITQGCIRIDDNSLLFLMRVIDRNLDNGNNHRVTVNDARQDAPQAFGAGPVQSIGGGSFAIGGSNHAF